MLRSVVIATTATFLCVGVPCNAKAQNCTDWNTRGFFEAASVADVQRCLSEGADIDTRDENDITPLHWAAGRGSAEAAMALIAAGADIEARMAHGSTPLHAALYGALVGGFGAETAKLLIDAGADIDARTKNGETALHLAARWGNAERVEMLLDAGSDAKARTGVASYPLT